MGWWMDLREKSKAPASRQIKAIQYLKWRILTTLEAVVNNLGKAGCQTETDVWPSDGNPTGSLSSVRTCDGGIGGLRVASRRWEREFQTGAWWFTRWK